MKKERRKSSERKRGELEREEDLATSGALVDGSIRA
jgi:hypothetical protein